MSITITEKILAQHAGLDEVVPGQLITAATGTIENRTTNKHYQARSFPPFMQELISAGGLIPYIEGRKKNA